MWNHLKKKRRIKKRKECVKDSNNQRIAVLEKMMMLLQYLI